MYILNHLSLGKSCRLLVIMHSLSTYDIGHLHYVLRPKCGLSLSRDSPIHDVGYSSMLVNCQQQLSERGFPASEEMFDLLGQTESDAVTYN